mmetsp:Transcript_138545/g.196114  ORF Transcript_138545/g.196114 Transcript_138545/m.196114 type:complete len:423 (+) Transcript_138545:32-1300(+)
MHTTGVVWFVSFLVVGCYCQGSCIIKNSHGIKTDLSSVEDAVWTSPVTSGGEEFLWSLSLCQPSRGVCAPDYSAYLQQGPYCGANAYFTNYTSAVGGQGETIFLAYKGNPTIKPPIMGRVAEVAIQCDPKGSYTKVTNCTVETKGVGANYIYNLVCRSKVACAGAPGPAPPTPPPPPSSCIIKNTTSGAETNLAVVKDHIWVGPDRRNGVVNFTWSLSLCQPAAGICKQKYNAYLQQGPDCSQNAYFQQFSSAVGGQGSRIFLTYMGNPTTHKPIMGRVGHVIIVCDPEGEYSKLSGCGVEVEPAGYNFVYTIQCNGKIACAGAPPSPPPPPPAKCGCDFGLWEDSKNCLGPKGIEGVTGGADCTHFTDATGNHYSVAVAAGCREYNLYKGPDCVNGFMGTFPANHCNTTKTGSSAVLFCPP